MTKNVTTYIHMISSSTAAARQEVESCPRGFICALSDPLQDIADLNQTYSCAQLQQDAIGNGYGDILDGIYCPEGSNSIEYCPIGNYCEDPASDPIICPAGFYCPVMTKTPLFQCRHCGEGSLEFAIIILPFILLWIFFILLTVASKWRRISNMCRTPGGTDKAFEDCSDQMIDDWKEKNPSGAQINSHSYNLDKETGGKNEAIDNWKENPSGSFHSHSSNSDNEAGKENTWNGIEISARNLSLVATAKRQEKTLVNDFTGTLKKGSMTAVMGSTGVGKTSLLNALSGRAHYGKVTGNLKIDGHEVHISDFANMIGFVPQDDIFDAELTVKENFVYAGLFKSPRSTKRHEIEMLADKVIFSLGLENVTNSIIRNGVSGGERKRVNVGVELMGKPGILFIDEPTTSLDSTVALSLMKVLKKLPQLHGVTVCCSIHQPGPRIFELFHSLILMSIGGRLAYNGPTDGLVNYFSNEFDYDIPRPDLVAEWVLDISVGIKDDSTENKRRNQIRICKAWADRGNNNPDTTAQMESVHHPMTMKGVLSQTWLQLHRNSVFCIRNFDTFILDTFQILLGITLFSLIVGPRILFLDEDLNMPYEYQIMTSITNDGGSIFGKNLNYLFQNSIKGIEREVTEASICGALPSIVIALSTTRYLTDKRRQFFREAASGYSVTAYYIAINIWSTFEVTLKMLLIGTSYYTLRNSAASSGATLISFVLLGWISSAWGMFFPIFCPPKHASIVTGVFVTFGCLLLSGQQAPFHYHGIYDAKFKAFVADSFGPLRFFNEAIAVSEYRTTPPQYGFTGQYPYGSSLFDNVGLAQLSDAETRTEQSRRGWYWGVWPSICHGLAIRVLSLILIHLCNRPQQVKKPIWDEIKEGSVIARVQFCFTIVMFICLVLFNLYHSQVIS